MTFRGDFRARCILGLIGATETRNEAKLSCGASRAAELAPSRRVSAEPLLTQDRGSAPDLGPQFRSSLRTVVPLLTQDRVSAPDSGPRCGS